MIISAKRDAKRERKADGLIAGAVISKSDGWYWGKTGLRWFRVEGGHIAGLYEATDARGFLVKPPRTFLAKRFGNEVAATLYPDLEA